MIKALECFSGLQRLAPIVNTRYGLIEAGVTAYIVSCEPRGKYIQGVVTAGFSIITECALICLRKEGSKGLGFGSFLLLRTFTIGLNYGLARAWGTKKQASDVGKSAVAISLGVLGCRVLGNVVKKEVHWLGDPSWFLV